MGWKLLVAFVVFMVVGCGARWRFMARNVSPTKHNVETGFARQQIPESNMPVSTTFEAKNPWRGARSNGACLAFSRWLRARTPTRRCRR